MFTIIGAMAELESSLISERVTAGMKAAAARGKHLGRPPIPRHVVTEIRALAGSTDLSVRSIHKKLAGKVSRGIVGEITKRVRSHQKGPFPSLSTLVTGFSRILRLPEPHCQTPALAQASIIGCPVRHLAFLLRDVVANRDVGLERHGGIPDQKTQGVLSQPNHATNR
jgi:hypothetical protein